MKPQSRMLSVLLALVMVLGMLPAAAWAAPAAEPVSEPETVRGGGGAALLWTCDFSGENDLLGWQIIDSNADDHTFERVQDETSAEWYMRTSTREEETFGTVQQDDYLISPRIELPDTNLEYELCLTGAGILNGGYNADCKIYVYTGNDMLRPDNLYTLLGAPYRHFWYFWDVWQTDYMDLSAYAGQTVQLVFRHCNADKSVLKLKELSVYWQAPDEQLAKVTALHVPAPELGVNVDTLLARESEITFPAYANYELVPGSLTYFKTVSEQSVEMKHEVFTADGEYDVMFRVRPKAGIQVYDQGRASVNGKWAQFRYYEEENEVRVDYYNLPALDQTREVREVNLRVTPPVVGTVPDQTTERWLADGSTDYHYTVVEDDWDPPQTEIFQSGETYGIFDGIVLEDGYVMAENPHFTVNGEPAIALGSNELNEWYIIKNFHADYKTPLEDAALRLDKPRADALPGYPSAYSSHFWAVSCDWYPVNAFGEVQAALGEGETLEPATTYWVCIGLQADEDYGFAGSTRVYVGETEAVFYREDDGVWYYCLPMKTRSTDPITVTFNAHGHGTAPDPIEIPYGSSLSDGYDEQNDLRMENTDGLVFWGWSEYASDQKDDCFDWERELYDDITLYAIWVKEYDSLTLYVDRPIAMEPIQKPITSVTNAYGFKPEALGWWDSADGYWQEEAPLSGAFQPDKTYYGVVCMEPELDAFFSGSGSVVSVAGAAKVREDLMEDGTIYVTFSVTVPRRGSIDEIDLLVDIGWNAWLMFGTPPTQLCLTSGVGLVEGSWWENLEDVGDESKAITDRFPTGCLIYTDLQAFPSLNCMIADHPTVNIDGGTLVRTEPGASGSLHIIYSVWSQAYHGMEFRSQGSGWFLVDDDPHAHKWHEGPFFETGTHTVTAVPDSGWHFKGWYEGRNADVLVSTDPVYVFENEPSDEDLYLTVVFEEGVLSVDRIEIEVPVPFAGDSFNWETESAGAGVVNDAPVRITEDKWYNEWGISGNPLPFEEGQNYFVGIELVANAGYQITEDTVILINREEVAWKQQSNVTTWSVSSRNYTMTAPIPVELVEIQVRPPVIGEKFYYDYDSADAFVTNGAMVEICEDKWVTDGGIGGNPLPFEEGHFYRLVLTLNTQPGYAFTDQTVLRINGEVVDRMLLNGLHSCSAASKLIPPEAPKLIETMDIAIHHIPAAGESFDPDYDVVFASTMAQIEWLSTIWRDADAGPDTIYPLTFREGGQYYASFVIYGASGWNLTDDTAFTINGEPAASCTKVGVGIYRLDSRPFTVHEEQVIPTVEVYANKPVYDIAPSDPYIPDYMPYGVEDWIWSDAAGNPLPKDFTVVGGAEYTLTVMVKPEEGYMFSAEELTARMFWDEAEIVSVEPHLLTLRASCTAGMGTPSPFVDVKKGDWFYESVIWAYYHDPRITSGTDKTHFSPNATCTRAQVMTFLWHANMNPDPANTTNPFTDVKAGEYYTLPVLWAYYHTPKITGGTTATTFGINDPCKREQVVTFLWAAAGRPEPAATENPFTDVKEGQYYYKAVLWAVENRITKGMSADTFGVGKTCTRAQIVTFLYAAYGPKG